MITTFLWFKGIFQSGAEVVKAVKLADAANKGLDRFLITVENILPQIAGTLMLLVGGVLTLGGLYFLSVHFKSLSKFQVSAVKDGKITQIEKKMLIVNWSFLGFCCLIGYLPVILIGVLIMLNVVFF